MKILFIDDDPSMTELLGMMLAPSLASIKSANNGPEGLKLINIWKPDIVLIDLMIPGMDGWQICTEIRKISKIPILILSVIDNPSVVAKALNAGADDYLAKPVPKAILLAHINNLTRRGRMNRVDHPQFEVTLATA